MPAHRHALSQRIRDAMQARPDISLKKLCKEIHTSPVTATKEYHRCKEGDDEMSCRKIKVGDKVKITRKAESHEKGWGDTWQGGMDNFVGTSHTVLELYSKKSVRISGTYYSFPCFVLEIEVP